MEELTNVTAQNYLETWEETNQESLRLFRRASEVTPAGVHHNMRLSWPFPLFFERGEGAYKWDVDGKRYVDYAVGQGSLLLGHAHPAVVRAVSERFMPGVPGGNHPLEIEWAELVQELVPSAQKVRFVSSGTEATMLAMRLARAHTGKPKIVRFEGHFHGWHDYGMLGYRIPFDESASAGIPDEVLQTILFVPSDDDGRRLDEILQQEEVAAVILEPSGASWGTVPLKPGFASSVRQLTEKHDALLIFDEVITGFRFSPGGVQRRDGILPDLTTLGKIVSGGFQGGVVGGRADVLDLMIPGAGGPYVLHHGTFNGHPVAAAAGIATLKEARSGEPQRLADNHAAELRRGLQSILDTLSINGFSYGESSTFHIYLESATGNSPNASSVDLQPELSLSAEQLMSIPPSVIGRLTLELRRRGVDLFSYNGGMASSAHRDAELEWTLAAFEQSLRVLRDEEIVAVA